MREKSSDSKRNFPKERGKGGEGEKYRRTALNCKNLKYYYHANNYMIENAVLWLNILSCVYAYEAIHISAIARELGVPQPTVWKNVKEMEQEGLVKVTKANRLALVSINDREKVRSFCEEVKRYAKNLFIYANELEKAICEGNA